MDNIILPKVTDVVRQMSGYEYYSKIDIKSFYNNFKMKSTTEPYTCFTWLNRQYTHRGAPFGLNFLPTLLLQK